MYLKEFFDHFRSQIYAFQMILYTILKVIFAQNLRFFTI